MVQFSAAYSGDVLWPPVRKHSGAQVPAKKQEVDLQQC